MSVAEEASPKTTYFEGVTPILPVANLQASIDHYVNVLGFNVDWQVTGFASVSRGRCNLMLCEGEQGHPGTWVWVGVGDADLIFEEYRAKGAKIRHPPNNYTWAYEVQVYDIDGNVLRLGSEPKTDQPVGTWLDKDGVQWKQSDGKWLRVEVPQP